MLLHITTWQRTMLLQILGGMQGNVGLVRQASRAMDILELSEDEKETIGYQDLGDGAATWDQDKRDMRWSIEIEDKETVSMVQRAVMEYSSWPVGMAETVIDLADQVDGKRAIPSIV